MLTVKINENKALQMLLDRCEAWETSKDNIDLFEKMYENYINLGCFDDAEFDVMQIVDNDVVNWTSVLYKNDYDTKEYKADFEKLLKLYKDGERDVSCETFDSIGKISFIEAVSDDESRILIR